MENQLRLIKNVRVPIRREFARSPEGALLVELPAATMRTLEQAARIADRPVEALLVPFARRIAEAVQDG